MTDAGATTRPRPARAQPARVPVRRPRRRARADAGQLPRHRQPGGAARSRTTRATKAWPSRSSTSSCPAGWRRRSRSTPSRTRRSSTAARSARSTTKLAGEVFSETIPKIAAIADKITVVRSMTHGEAAHERGTHNMFTGYRPSPALQYPSMGSRRQPRVRPAEQPAAVRLRPEREQPVRRQRLSLSRVRPVQPRRRSGGKETSRCAT